LDHGADLGFETIATVRGETLHNHPCSRTCQKGDLFLLDAGAEICLGYSGDLTTTFPVDRRFSSRQKDLYLLLRRVFAKAVDHLGPGRRFLDAHLAACMELATGLGELGLMKGDPQEAVAQGAHALFFPHGLGHMIGLDVHDMENLGEDAVGYGPLSRSEQFGLRSLRLAKALEPGMVHSVEPGIYFIPGLIDRWHAEGRAREFVDYDALEGWRGERGMRLEEDWLVTAGGSRRLGPDFNRSVEAIEAQRA
jgi:Xaa-Pro aminopeptidase